MYKESWVCQLTHVGVFEKEKGIFNKIKYYDALENNNLVSFDSAYDYIAVPISEKQHIEKLLDKAELQCKERKKSQSKNGEGSLRNRIREQEVTITCETDFNELKEKDLALSFVLQGYSYSLPLEQLFVKASNGNGMDMLIKYIDDENAIWTFGYPFMNQFLMIFNMEDNHVGIKKLKKTALPIISINNKDWLKYKLEEESTSSSSVFKIIAYSTLVLVALAIVFFVYHAIRKRNINSSKSGMNNIENNNKDIIY
jgi:hypothetical protein